MIGTLVFNRGLTFFKKVWRITLNSIIARCYPIQFLGPAKNGIKEKVW